MRLIALMVGLMLVMWAVHWYFFQLPGRAMSDPTSAVSITVRDAMAGSSSRR